LNLYAAIKIFSNKFCAWLVKKNLKEKDLIQFEGILAWTFSGWKQRNN